MATKVLVGVDGSDCAVEALQYVAGLFGDAAEITTLTSWRWPASTYGVAGVADWDPRADAQHAARDTLDRAFGEDRPAGVHADVCEGQAAANLIERSADFDLVVVGSRGHGGFTGLLLGSLSGAVAAHAKAPVLVYHPRS